MLERAFITVIILSGLMICWFGWSYYKARLISRIDPAEQPSGRPTLLYFSADYCAPCKLQQTPIIDQLSARLGDSIAVKRYDVTRQPDLAHRYKVLTLPTTVILDERGQVAHVNYGVTARARLEKQLQL